LKKTATAALLMLGLGLGLSLAIVTGPARSQLFDASDLTGEELFLKYCAACHGPDGLGNGPVAPSLTKVVPNLQLLAERNAGRFPAQLIRETIDGRAMAAAHGTRMMPIWGYEFWVEEGADVTAEREAREIIDRLVLHVESLQKEPRTGFERD
jgi:mono/diheme cytochrome c family protein